MDFEKRKKQIIDSHRNDGKFDCLEKDINELLAQQKAMMYAEIESLRPWIHADKKIQAKNKTYEKALSDVLKKIQDL